MSRMWEYLQSAERQISKIPYREVPVLVTNTNQVACIPYGTDIPCIGLCGRRRSGKTTCMHTNADMVWHRGLARCFFLNDAHDQTLTFSMPNKEDGKGHLDKLDVISRLHSIGMEPKRFWRATL